MNKGLKITVIVIAILAVLTALGFLGYEVYKKYKDEHSGNNNGGNSNGNNNSNGGNNNGGNNSNTNNNSSNNTTEVVSNYSEWAEQLHEAIEGAGTDKYAIIAVFEQIKSVSMLEKLLDEYKNKYSIDFEDDLQDEWFLGKATLNSINTTLEKNGVAATLTFNN